MITALKIIERAFAKCGIRAAETPLQASEVADGLDILNDLIASWGATATLKGVDPVKNATDNVNAPRHSWRALKANLAIEIATEYGIEVSQGLAFNASNSLSEMVKAEIDLRNINFPSTLPMGSGNYFGSGYDDFFPEDQAENF